MRRELVLPSQEYQPPPPAPGVSRTSNERFSPPDVTSQPFVGLLITQQSPPTATRHLATIERDHAPVAHTLPVMSVNSTRGSPGTAGAFPASLGSVRHLDMTS